MNSRIATPESNALAVICREWYINFGAITAAVLISLWANPLWMPLYELILAVLLAIFGPGRKISSGEPCGRITLITVYTLLFTALISFIINVAYHTELIHLVFDISTLNHSIPYITSLVIFPVCFVLTAVLNSKKVYAHHVHNCHLHNQFNSAQPTFGRMVHATYRSLLKRLTVMVAIISIIDWGYYFLCYRNNVINSPDRFFFFFVPAAIYVWSIVFVNRSYSLLAMTNGRLIHAKTTDGENQIDVLTDSSVVRFLVVRHGTLLLDVSESAIRDCNIDTPLVEIKPLSFKGSIETARRDFEHRTGISDFRIRELYHNHSKVYNNNIYHFLVSIDNDNVNTDLLPGQWVGIDEIDRMMRMGVASTQFTDEVFRIYTIAMAWKTYDRKGRRRFPIRNYHPNFRLTDLFDYDVDFSDDHWLKVSRINQDGNLWHLRRFRLNEGGK